MEPANRRRALREECSSGTRKVFDPVALMASSGRGSSQRVPRRLRLMGIAVAEPEQEIIADLGDRYEVRFRDGVPTAARDIADEQPDILVLDEDGTTADAFELLDSLSKELWSPVVVVVTSKSDRPSLARIFGVPSLGKPVSADQLRAAIEVALDQRLRPIPRRTGE